MTFLVTVTFGVGLFLVTSAADHAPMIDAIRAVLQGQPIKSVSVTPGTYTPPTPTKKQ